jgi:hypothetical protein
MMKAWEAKATKRAANATGFTLMAVSLAACNDDAVVSGADETPDEQTPDVQAPVDQAPVVAGFQLTNGADNLSGNASDNTFVAVAGQNQNGEIVNQFATGDRLDGGAGSNFLKATIMNDQSVDATILEVRAMTTNVQEMYFEVLGTPLANAVFINATRMENVEQWWSNFSDNNIRIHNINLQGDNLSITKDVTFGLADTNAEVGLVGTFDSQSLLAAGDTASNSMLEIRIVDVSTETPATPLANVNMTLSFSLGGEIFTLTDIQADGGTYAGLITSLQTALAAEGLGSVDISAGEDFTSLTFAGNTVDLPFTASEILLVDPAGGAFTGITFEQAAIEPVADGFLVAGNATAADPTLASNLIETNLILDNAGRGSLGGEVVLGGQSTSDLGVQQFNVIVDRDSKIAALLQTDEAEVGHSNIANGGNADKLESIVISSMGVDGDLYIGAVDAGLRLINATAFEGDALSLGERTDVLNLTNFNAAGVETDITFEAAYNGAGRASSAQEFTITTGTGDDEITASVIGTSTSGSTNAELTIVSAGGDNTLVLSSTDVAVNEAIVTLGAGDDTVTGGATHLTANTGAGDDVIYAENTGTKTVAVLLDGTYDTAVTGALNGTGLLNSQLLNGRTVQVTVAMPEGDVAGVAEVAGFENGYELETFVFTSGAELSTEREFYDAIASAINSDQIVNKLATASVDSNGNLVVTYLVDGVTIVDEQMVEVTLNEEFADAAAVTADATLLAAVRAEINDSTATDAAVFAAYGGVATDTYAIVTGAEFATAATSTEGAAGESEVQSINFTGITAGADGSFTVGGVTVTVLAADTTQQIADKVVIALNNEVAGTLIGDATADNAGGTSPIVTVTFAAANGNVGDTTLAPVNGSAALTFIFSVFVNAQGVTQEFEVQTIDVSGISVANGGTLSFLIDGTTVVYTNTTANALTGDALETNIATIANQVINGSTYAFTNASAAPGDLTITQSVVGDNIAAITAGRGVSIGTNSTTEGDNTINAGPGDDVIVLSSNDAQTDKIVFDTGAFGNDVIVHFEVGATGDVLDFTAWLDNAVSASGSTASEVRVDTTLAADIQTIVANSVAMANFGDVVTGFGTGAITFDGLTDAQLLAALNGSAAGGSSAEFQADATATLVGTSGKAILIIHNDIDGDGAVDAGDNFGEYLVAEITFADDGVANNVQDEFSSANIIGTLDFGELETLVANNFA